MVKRKIHDRRGHIDDRQQRCILPVGVQVPRGEPGVGQAIIGKLYQTGCRPLHAVEARALRHRCGAQAQVFQRGLEDRQRRSELMRHHSHKLALVEAGLAFNL